MAACPACNREMAMAPSCDPRPGAVRYGDEPVLAGVEPPERCYDCGVARGGFHHRFCDREWCPVCPGQLISCAHAPGWASVPGGS